MSRTRIETVRLQEGYCACPAPEEDSSRWEESILSNKGGHLYIPILDLPEPDNTTARFIAKIGFEALASRCLNVPEWNDELVDKKELDELSKYVRLGNSNRVWPIHTRRIYPPDFCFSDLAQLS